MRAMSTCRTVDVTDANFDKASGSRDTEQLSSVRGTKIPKGIVLSPNLRVTVRAQFFTVKGDATDAKVSNDRRR